MGKLFNYSKEEKVKGPIKLIPLHLRKRINCGKLHVLGKMNPVSLNYTVYFLISQDFGTRGRQEHHQLKIEDLKVSHGIDGKLNG